MYGSVKFNTRQVNVVLGITIPGVVVIALTLTVYIDVCWKKSRRKHHRNERPKLFEFDEYYDVRHCGNPFHETISECSVISVKLQITE